MNLGERIKNETPKERQARIEKMKATREANKEVNAEKRKEKKLVTNATEKLLKRRWVWKDADGNKQLGNGAAMIAATLFEEARTVGGKNTIQAIDRIVKLVGEDKQEVEAKEITIKFANGQEIDV